MRFLRQSVALLLVLALMVPVGLAQNAPAQDQQQRPPQQQGQGQRPGGPGRGQEEAPRDPLTSPATYMGLRLRSIGPALTSGRVVAFAVNPADRSHYYVAVASGGVWRTLNSGTSWTPVFDNEGSYSIGAVAMDPKNPSVVWVGTGELNSQRSVGYGDGIYRSEDAGRSWRNLGLKKSEHIARIVIDPRNSDVVYVAAQGPLWGPGGDRGLYKTTDGGKNWTKLFETSENTGVTEIMMDPTNPDVLYAATYQRRRHFFTLINGGPESAIHKSTDAGATWTRLRSGLPNENMGRIGLAISPVNHRLIYATIEAANNAGGIFRSNDAGATWQRRNPFDTQGQYYGQIIADPKDPERIYVMNVQIQVSDDGGTTLRPIGERNKHVDNHAFWVDPNNTNYYLSGCDGGVYESFDRGANWHFKSNLPVAQFYDVTVDDSKPFYFVYGGTQDNFSLGGPSGTRSATGITNADWFVTNGGDGFHSRVDPVDTHIVYATSQNGGLVRFDRRNGERVGIQPQEGKGEASYRWNWDSPLIVSPHNHKRIYFGANFLFRSDDQGNSWTKVSPDLSRQIDRDKLPVMGRVWGPDAVAKNVSTAFYGNLSAIAESPKKEGLLYVGTDDGLIQVTEDGGRNWRKVEKLPGVPENAYVTRILPSQHEVNTAYATIGNHQNADFAPYVVKTTDTGRTWTSIAGDLPANGPVWAIAEDHVNPNLLFVGTEFGLYFTIDGGQKWIRLRGGLPTIAVRDLAIQKRENDLVLATFGRGFYILDDYTPLRLLKPDLFQKDASLFPIQPARMYLQSTPYGGRGKGMQGESFYAAENPPLGATITLYLKEAIRTKRQQRQQAERAAERRNETPPYPTWEQMRAEAEEEAPGIILTVTDASGNVVRRLNAANRPGIQRVTWDMRLPAATIGGGGGGFGGGGGGGGGAAAAARGEPGEGGPQQGPSGELVLPGEYKVSVAKRVDGQVSSLAGPVAFTVVADGVQEMAPADRAALAEFQRKVGKLQGAVSGALQIANETQTRLTTIKRAIESTPGTDNDRLRATANGLEKRLREILLALRGDTVNRARTENVPVSISQRVNDVAGTLRLSTARPTQTSLEQFKIAAEEFAPELAKLRALVEGDLAKLEKALDAAGVPWTPGRFPEWK